MLLCYYYVPIFQYTTFIANLTTHRYLILHYLLVQKEKVITHQCFGLLSKKVNKSLKKSTQRSQHQRRQLKDFLFSQLLILFIYFEHKIIAFCSFLNIKTKVKGNILQKESMYDKIFSVASGQAKRNDAFSSERSFKKTE